MHVRIQWLILLFITPFLFSSHVFGGTTCTELKSCVDIVSSLTGKKYVANEELLRGKFMVSSNFQLSADNADTLFTSLLELNELARVPTNDKETYTIIKARDVRYAALPMIEVDSQTTPNLPKNNDYYQVTINFKHYKQGQLREAANSTRPYSSRFGRTSEFLMTGKLIIVDTANKILTMSELIKHFDKELSPDELPKTKNQKKQ